MIEISEVEALEFLRWIDAEIARIESGGDLPDCFDGTREECLESMRAEASEMRKAIAQ